MHGPGAAIGARHGRNQAAMPFFCSYFELLVSPELAVEAWGSPPRMRCASPPRASATLAAMTGRSNTPASRTAAAALGLVLLFCASVLAAHALRPEYDGWRAPLSFYLSGPHSAWLRAGYYGLALGAVLLAFDLRRTLAPAARHTLVPVLLAGGGFALAVTATFPGPSPGHSVSDAGAVIHGLSAIASFLLVGVAMLLQSSPLHRDPYWRPVAMPLLVLAALGFGGLWLHALWKTLPRGGSQKAVITLYMLWLGTVAWRLRSAPAIAMEADDAGTATTHAPPAGVSD